MMRRLLLALSLCATAAPAHADPDNYSQVERGRALVTAGDCIACHTPPEGPRFGGGRGIVTPFGTINSANITPDQETGIGAWTQDDFARAMSEGIRSNGQHLYPAFPYPFYTRVTRADTDDIFAFLRTLPAVHKVVNRDTLPFPFDIRASMLAWNTINFSQGEFTPDPARTPEYNRGAYLVEGLGHCGACHTPMNSLGGSRNSRMYQGNNILTWVAPNLTNDDHTGLGTWSVAEIVEYLRTGRNAHAAAAGPMAEVVQYSTALMPEPDVKAMATYLKQRGAAGPYNPNLAPIRPDDATMQAGAAIYRDTCSACHTAEGRGIPRLFPQLAGSPSVQQEDPTTLARVVVSGARTAATSAAPTSPAMPALGWRLDDNQIAAVLTYIRNTWGNAAPAVSRSDVAKVREKVTTN